MPEIKSIKGEGWGILIWETMEPITFFKEALQLNEYEQMRMHAFKHEGRALHFLCARYLLRKLLPHLTPTAFVANGEIPIVKDEDIYISISHSGSYVSAMFHRKVACGVDIQDYDIRVIKIKDKFSTEEERGLLPSSLDELKVCIAIWAAKEAIFKCMQIPGLDFRTDMVLKAATTHQLIFDFSIEHKEVTVDYALQANYCVAYCNRG